MSYTHLAAVYDMFAYDFDYDEWTSKYLKMLLDLKPDVKSVCDCGCGTGSIAVRLAKLGYTVTGVDLSEDMLRIASDKAYSLRLKIPFIKQDMRELRLTRPVDAVICACDGVNYLTSPDGVNRFFLSANKCLKPGGVLAFDISSRAKLVSLAQKGFYGEEIENAAYLWQNETDPKSETLKMRITFFVRDADGRYSRFEETHIQKMHTTAAIKSALNECGFTNISISGGDDDISAGPGGSRVYFAAVKA